ncbi:hypothetical protein SDC9_200193 [bioreactor metagenome]|uniref:Uncharacterized protein n=1 Tax=bioreactor metagenome TaxID=1076179 RepID=A0A645IMK1_9ZZZZ
MGEDAIATFFVCRRVMRALMQHLAFGGQPVFTPLLFNMDERPLTRAKAKMLDARYSEEIFLAIFRYPIISNETLCGIALGSTSTQ